MTARRAFLIKAVSIGMLLAGIGFSVVLVASLRPTEATISAHRQEVDLSGLPPGEVLRVDWEGYQVIVLHRTPEQIEWLERYELVPPKGWVAAEQSDSYLANRFRSQRKDYLVVFVERYQEQVRLREIRQYSLCEEFVYDPKRHAPEKGTDLYGAFYCSRWYGHPVDDVPNSMFVYDIAGRNRNPWLAPLDIPPHYFHGETTLVLDRSA